MVTKQEFATLVVAMQAMYGEDFIGTEEALDVWYALLHDLDYHILSKALQQYMLTNKFIHPSPTKIKPTLRMGIDNQLFRKLVITD